MTRYCPHCNADLRDRNIYEFFLDLYKGDEKRAALSASNYGGDGYFYKTIAIYNQEKDRTTHYKCPNCNGEWNRE